VYANVLEFGPRDFAAKEISTLKLFPQSDSRCLLITLSKSIFNRVSLVQFSHVALYAPLDYTRYRGDQWPPVLGRSNVGRSAATHVASFPTDRFHVGGMR